MPFFLLAFVIGALWLHLANGPLVFDSMADRVAEALERQFGNGFDVDVKHAQIEWNQGGPLLAISGVTVRDGAGNLVIAAPQAEIGFSASALATGNLVPRNISFVGLAVTLTVAADGGVSISATGDDEPSSPPANPAGQPTDTSFGPGAILKAVASHEGPMAVLEQAGIREGRLRVNDKRRGRSISYDRMSLGFEKIAGSQVAGRLSAQGPSGAWTVSATIDDAASDARQVRLETRNLPMSDIIGIAEPGTLPIYTDMPISGSLTLKLDDKGNVADLDGKLTGGSAVLLIDDRDARPVFLDRVTGDFGWNAAEHALIVRTIGVKAGDTNINLSGTVTPPRETGESWRVELAGRNATLAGESPQDAAVKIDSVSLSARMPLGLGAVFVDRIDLSGGNWSITGSLSAGRTEGFEGLRVFTKATSLDARAALAFWPSFISADARNYLLDSVISGQVDRVEVATSFTPQTLAQSVARKPIPAEAVRIDAALSNVRMRPAPGLPVLSGLSGTMTGTGRTFRADVTRATGPPFAGKSLAYSNGRYVVDDLAAFPHMARVDFDVAGGVDAMLDTLRADSLKPHFGIRLDPAGVKGNVDGHVTVAFPLKPDLKPTEVKIQASAKIAGVAADLAGRDRLEGGNFTLQLDDAGLAIKGDGRLTGSPATLELKQPRSTNLADVTITMTLDDAARVRRGIRLAGQLSGPVDFKAMVHDAFGSKPSTRVEADLTKAVVNDLIPGWDKAAGKPAKASFRLESDGDTSALDDIVLDAAGGVSLRGSLKVSNDGPIIAARFSSLKLGPGEDLRVDLDRQGQGMKAVVRGSTIDARPVLRAIMSPRSGSLPSVGDLDLDLKAQAIIGENSEKLSGVDLKTVVKGGEIRDFRLSGRFDHSPVSGQMARTERNTAGIVIESGDAGAFLRFADIYRRMLGGTLLLQVSGSGSPLGGTLIANNFFLSNEPALGRVGPSPEAGEKANNVAFTKLRASFLVGGGKLEIRESTMYGPAVGGTIEGALDFARDKVDLSGTFVPAYGLNNIVSQVPLVGPILGGGKNEGLFGVNFRITGKVTEPVLSINPLSAVAPGFLRKFFGVLGPGDVPQTSSTVRDPADSKAGR